MSIALPEYAVDLHAGDRFTIFWRRVQRSDDDASATWVLRRDGAILLAALLDTRPEVFDDDLVPEVSLEVGRFLCHSPDDCDPVPVVVGPGCEGKHPETICCDLAGQSLRVEVEFAFIVSEGCPVVTIILSDPQWVIPGEDRVDE